MRHIFKSVRLRWETADVKLQTKNVQFVCMCTSEHTLCMGEHNKRERKRERTASKVTFVLICFHPSVCVYIFV